MIKVSVTALFLVAMASVAANAQSDGSDTGRSVSAPSRGLLNQDYLTSTGETVPRPGAAPLNPDVTPLDRQIRDNNDRVERSICSNC
jgi:hypothetical protein